MYWPLGSAAKAAFPLMIDQIAYGIHNNPSCVNYSCAFRGRPIVDALGNTGPCASFTDRLLSETSLPAGAALR